MALSGVILRRVFFVALRGVGIGDTDKDDCLDLRGDDAALLLAVGELDVPGSFSLGIREGTASLCAAASNSLTVKKDRCKLYAGSLSCVPVLGVELAVPPSVLCVLDVILGDCPARASETGIFDALSDSNDLVSASLFEAGLGCFWSMPLLCCGRLRELDPSEVLGRGLRRCACVLVFRSICSSTTSRSDTRSIL